MDNLRASQYDGKLKHLFPSTARFAGYPIAVLGALALLSTVAHLFSGEVTLLQILAPPACMAMGYIMVSSYEGIRIDTEFMRYRRYSWIAGFRQGDWIKLPVIVGISVIPFKTGYVQRDAIAPSIRIQVHGLYRVLLSVENSRIGIVAAISKDRGSFRKSGIAQADFWHGRGLCPSLIFISYTIAA